MCLKKLAQGETICIKMHCGRVQTTYIFVPMVYRRNLFGFRPTLRIYFHSLTIRIEHRSSEYNTTF